MVRKTAFFLIAGSSSDCIFESCRGQILARRILGAGHRRAAGRGSGHRRFGSLGICIWPRILWRRSLWILRQPLRILSRPLQRLSNLSQLHVRGNL